MCASRYLCWSRSLILATPLRAAANPPPLPTCTRDSYTILPALRIPSPWESPSFIPSTCPPPASSLRLLDHIKSVAEKVRSTPGKSIFFDRTGMCAWLALRSYSNLAMLEVGEEPGDGLLYLNEAL